MELNRKICYRCKKGRMFFLEHDQLKYMRELFVLKIRKYNEIYCECAGTEVKVDDDQLSIEEKEERDIVLRECPYLMEHIVSSC